MSDDPRTETILKKATICYKCGAENTGRAYSAALRGRTLKVCMIRFGQRGMHKECAEAWVERRRATPENAHLIPDIAVAEARYRAAVDSAERQLEKIRDEIRDEDWALSLAIRKHYDRSIDQLKGRRHREYPLPTSPQQQALDAQPGLLEELRGSIRIASESQANALQQIEKQLSLRTVGDVNKDLIRAIRATGTAQALLAKIQSALSNAMFSNDKVIDIRSFKCGRRGATT